MPLRGSGFAVGTITNDPVFSDWDNVIPGVSTVMLGTSTDNFDGTFTPNISSSPQIGLAYSRVVPGASLFPSNGGVWNSQILNNQNPGDPNPLPSRMTWYLWNGSAWDSVLSDHEAPYIDTSITGPVVVTITPTVYTYSVSDNATTCTTASDRWSVARTYNIGVSHSDSTTTLGTNQFLVPVTIPSLGITLDNGVVATGGAVVIDADPAWNGAAAPVSGAGGSLLTSADFSSVVNSWGSSVLP